MLWLLTALPGARLLENASAKLPAWSGLVGTAQTWRLAVGNCSRECPAPAPGTPCSGATRFAGIFEPGQWFCTVKLLPPAPSRLHPRLLPPLKGLGAALLQSSLATAPSRGKWLLRVARLCLSRSSTGSWGLSAAAAAAGEAAPGRGALAGQEAGWAEPLASVCPSTVAGEWGRAPPWVSGGEPSPC